MADFIPGPDTDFDIFQKKFVGAIVADPAKYGSTPAQAAALQADQTAWTTAYPAHINAQAAELTASSNKKGARTKFETDMRAAQHKMKGTATVDDTARAAAGLAPQDHARTPAGEPATRPILRLEPSGHGALIVHFSDAATPTRKAKPPGIHGAEIWSHVGDPAPADASGFGYLGLDTRTPYLDQHPAADAGKTVYYMARWQNGKGENGPWSDVVSGKIPV